MRPLKTDDSLIEAGIIMTTAVRLRSCAHHPSVRPLWRLCVASTANLQNKGVVGLHIEDLAAGRYLWHRLYPAPRSVYGTPSRLLPKGLAMAAMAASATLTIVLCLQDPGGLDSYLPCRLLLTTGRHLGKHRRHPGPGRVRRAAWCSPAAAQSIGQCVGNVYLGRRVNNSPDRVQHDRKTWTNETSGRRERIATEPEGLAYTFQRNNFLNGAYCLKFDMIAN